MAKRARAAGKATAGKRAAKGAKTAAGSARKARPATARKAARKAPKAGARTARAKKAKGKRAQPKKAAPRKAASRKAPKKAARAATRKPAIKTAKKVARKALARPAKKAAAGKVSPPVAPKKAAAQPRVVTRPKRAKRPAPIREAIPSSLTVSQGSSSARSGRDEMTEKLQAHNETSPAITAGDLDADWEQAYSSGDEAPGGDNPTPDQDVVDEIGHALGIEYEPNEELKGAAKLEERDRHRWELDPASAEDYPDHEK